MILVDIQFKAVQAPRKGIKVYTEAPLRGTKSRKNENRDEQAQWKIDNRYLVKANKHSSKSSRAS